MTESTLSKHQHNSVTYIEDGIKTTNNISLFDDPIYSFIYSRRFVTKLFLLLSEYLFIWIFSRHSGV